MKKKTWILWAACMVLCSGCGQNETQTEKQESTVTDQVTESVVTEETTTAAEAETTTAAETAAQGVSVVPFDLAYRVYSVEDTLEDGSYPVNFSGSSYTETADGAALTVDVCNYELFSAGDIEGLQPGDTITSRDVEYVVDTVDVSEYGVEINGGYEQEDGLSFLREDDFYRVTFPDDRADYFVIGTVTLPLSKDVYMIDASGYTGDLSSLDYENPSEDIVFDYGDLATVISADSVWDANSVTITVEDGQITRILREWTP